MTQHIHQRSDKRVIRTKRAIKNALFKIMEEKELNSITISELSIAANVNRRTFYTHYRSIAEILDEIEAELVAEMTKLIGSADYSDFRRAMTDIFIGFHKLVTVEFDYYFHLIQIDERGLLVCRLKNALKTSSESIMNAIGGINSIAESTLLSSFISGGFMGFYREWYYSENRIPVEKAAEMVGTLAEGCMKLSKTI